ncbi:MAG TPA: UDP-galactopyranose mutase [Pirellulales bacterium]|jgi:UDP-galactopyranose mutase|nr:UDP-galactopyranose mutase [Pirellulales bacterium]
MHFDFVIVGCGMFGCVFARSVADRGKSALLVDKRDHIGGNCYTEQVAGIHVHRYGPHVFHTNSDPVWRFVNRFAEFNDYRHRIAVRFGERLYSFPINLLTLQQVWGVTTPREAEAKLAAVRIPTDEPEKLEAWILSQVGRELYEIFVRGYTTKQWGREPRELPASIIRRIPIRLTGNDRYFDDLYEGIPRGGYTRMFENMLDHPNIRVETGVDFFAHAAKLRGLGRTLVYTGMIDEFFDHRYGRLDYRSLRFESEVLHGDFQETAVVNYTDASVPYTRIVEHKHFDPQPTRRTVITREFPQAFDAGQTPYYPIRDACNSAIYDRYRAAAAASGVIFGGRLGTYQYYDMHQVVAQAMTLAERELGVGRTSQLKAA